MKSSILIALFISLKITSFAQEIKKEATVKIVVTENGKEKTIERRILNIKNADTEIQKLSDSLKFSVDGNKNKIIRVEINKNDRRDGGTQFNRREDFNRNFEQAGRSQRRVIMGRMSKGENPADVIIFEDNDSVNLKMGKRRNFDFQMQRGPTPFGRFMGARKRGREAMAFRGMNGAMPFEKIHKMHGEQQNNASKTIKGLNTYPNTPFNGKLNVRFNAPEKGNVTISVSDVNGKEISSEQIKDFSGLYLGQIDLKKSLAGVYFVRVTQSNDGAVRRVNVN